ncbi:protein-disulfide reductase DsbD [Thiobacter aerophilum]|uniref:Thiol:disulfide interchange protein DsbD n=1 Tax=Thiobacter aerophilum TaxID=3121275 RepID=A0ABV0ED90_9BURK
MRFFAALALLVSLVANAAEDGELLEPEKAFAFSARALDAATLEIRYRIAEGYYLYRDKFRFEVEPKSIALGTPQLPPGKVKQDEFFGRVETYRGTLTFKLPLVRPAPGQTLTLKSISQGCADVGVCYPPLAQTIKLTLPDTTPRAVGGLAALKDLGTELGGESDLLPPDQAFKVSAVVRDARAAEVILEPAPGYYLYRDKLKFKVVEGPASVTEVMLPKGEQKDDPNFGKTEVYHQRVVAELRLARSREGAARIVLEVGWQGCADKGVCYLPASRRFPLNLPAVAAAQPGAASPAPAPEATPPASPAEATQPIRAAQTSPQPSPKGATQPEDESSTIARLFQGGSFWLIIASFFGFGLLLALTPCVFPMIPILSGIIVGQGKQLTKMQGFVLSLAYVLGMAVTYAIAGVVAGLSGALISSALQNPWVLGAFALIFVALALSMFGFYELQMPNFIQSRFTEKANQIKGGNLTGVFVMGVLSAVIVGPCVAAPLAGALLYIGQTRDVWLGGFALFAMALGMGVPLLLVGVAGGALLPRAGAWMNAVKAFFGVMLLGVAIWLVSPVIPAWLNMLLWAALLIVSAIYLNALDPLPAGAPGFRKFWKGVGVIALLVGTSLLIGALSGSRDILQPLAGLRAAPAAASEATGLKFEKVAAKDFDTRLAAARGTPVMVDFYADWCVSCKEMERFTFSDPRVVARLAGVTLLKIDVTQNDEADKELLKRFNLFGPPGIIFLDGEGKERYRVVGYQPPEKFLKSIDAALK